MCMCMCVCLDMDMDMVACACREIGGEIRICPKQADCAKKATQYIDRAMTAYQYRQPTQEEYDEYDYGDNDSPQSYGGYGKSQQYGYDYDNRGLSEHTGHARQEEGDDSVSTPRIPIIQRVESGKENDDGLLSPRRFTEQVGAFEQMCAAGAGWGSALMAAVQGHKMTEEQAAICLQSHWRRHEAMVRVQRASITVPMGRACARTCAVPQFLSEFFQRGNQPPCMHALIPERARGVSTRRCR